MKMAEDKSDKELKLKVAEAIQDDVNKGIVRIDSGFMQEIGARVGDIVELEGERKTVAIADRAYPGDIGLNIIRMDGIIRKNAKTGIGEIIKVRKVNVKGAKKVIIAPARKGVLVRASPEIFKQGLLGRAVVKGDIVSLDLGILYKGFHSDMAITVAVGKISPEAKRLIEVTRKSLEIGIKKIKPGNRFGDISRSIQKYVEAQGFGAVRELCGHGIGKELHEDPQILNSVSMSKETVDKVKYQGEAKIKFKQGMVFCIEPMITAGDWRIRKSPDGFGYQTRDNSLSAHFEHTIAVNRDGYRILTG